jgi:hypothetical protein
MSILFSGDFHANARHELYEISRIPLLARFGQERYDAIRYHIILGDGGFLWPGNEEGDRHNFTVLNKRPFPILCVQGNHDPVLGMERLPEVDIGIGGPVLQIHDAPFTAYFKRGNIYTLEGFRFLALGGALSVDRKDRKPGVSWWEKEYWTEEEQKEVMELLATDHAFDYVLSHTGPHRINRKVFTGARASRSGKYRDEVAFLNDRIDSLIQCRQW